MEGPPSRSCLCPSPAWVNVSNFISSKLQWFPDTRNTNYETWKEQMLCLMDSQELTGYVDGSISPPLESSQDFKVWKRNNALVKGWILGSLSDEIGSKMVTMNSARDVWSHLEGAFGQPSDSWLELLPTLSYPSPSTASVNVASFVSTKLQWLSEAPEFTNYMTWKDQMLCLIVSQGLMEYIDGSIQFPLRSEQDSDTWKRNDALVKGWILGSLSNQIAADVVVGKFNSAHRIWEHLGGKFGRCSPVPALFYASQSTLSVNIANFVSAKLQWLPDVPAETNYKTWRKQIVCLLKSQRLMGYVDGSIALPLLPNQDVKVFNENNELVKGWILGSLSAEIASGIGEDFYAKPAKDIWSLLERKFGQIQGPPLNGTKQDTSKEQKKPTMNDSTRLHKGILDGDLGVVEEIFCKDTTPKTNSIDNSKTLRPLHVAVGTVGEKPLRSVTELVRVLAAEDLLLERDDDNSTALHTAAAVGNIKAVELLVQKQPLLCDIPNKRKLLPIHVAAIHRQRKVLVHLVEQIKDPPRRNHPYLDKGPGGQQLLTYLIQVDFFDIALRMLEKYPQMLRTTDFAINLPLTQLTIRMHKLGKRNSSMRERFISWWIGRFWTVQTSRSASNRASRSDNLAMTNHTIQESSVHNTREKLKVDEQARKLLECMCHEIGSQDFNQANEAFREAILVAAELDVRDVVKEIIDTCPGAIYSIAKPSGQNIFHKAIENRSADVFNLIYDMSDYRSFFTSRYEDKYGNTPLHSAGKLAPPHKLSQISCAALQMQSEMQWFTQVEKIVDPHSKEQKNCAGKTPHMVFTEEHRLLKEAGERWMKHTAASFTLVAVLIATVMFAGAITVPGGFNQITGVPILSKKPAFIIFAISDAVSLLASTTSLLLFLSILTSRYTEKDFLLSLPRKLMYGIATLILSILSMTVSFIATLFVVFGQNKQWVIFPLLISACMPVAAFVPYQSILLYELYSSTKSRGPFGKKRKRRFNRCWKGIKSMLQVTKGSA